MSPDAAAGAGRSQHLNFFQGPHSRPDMPPKLKEPMLVLVRLRGAPARGALRARRAVPALGGLAGVARPAYLRRLLWLFAGG